MKISTGDLGLNRIISKLQPNRWHQATRSGVDVNEVREPERTIEVAFEVRGHFTVKIPYDANKMMHEVRKDAISAASKHLASIRSHLVPSADNADDPIRFGSPVMQTITVNEPT